MNLINLEKYLPFVGFEGVPGYLSQNEVIDKDKIFIDRKIFKATFWSFVRSQDEDRAVEYCKLVELMGGIYFVKIEPLNLYYLSCDTLYYGYFVLALLDKSKTKLIKHFRLDNPIVVDLYSIRYDLVYKSLTKEGDYYVFDYFDTSLKQKVSDSYLIKMLESGETYSNVSLDLVFDSLYIKKDMSVQLSDVFKASTVLSEGSKNIYNLLVSNYSRFAYNEVEESSYAGFLSKYNNLIGETPSTIKLLVGLSGVAKSAIVKKVARSLNLEFLDIKLSFFDRFDVTGLYKVEEMVYSDRVEKVTKQGFLDVFIRASDEYLLYARKMLEELKSIKNNYLHFYEGGELSSIPDKYRLFFKKNGDVYLIDYYIDKFTKESRPCLIFLDEFYRISSKDVLDQIINFISQRRLLGRLNYRRSVVIGAANDVADILLGGESEDFINKDALFHKLEILDSSEYLKRFDIILMDESQYISTFIDFLAEESHKRSKFEVEKEERLKKGEDELTLLKEEMTKFYIHPLVSKFLLNLYKEVGKVDVFYDINNLKKKLSESEVTDFSHVTLRSWEFVSKALTYFDYKWVIKNKDVYFTLRLTSDKVVIPGELFNYLLPDYSYAKDFYKFLESSGYIFLEDISEDLIRKLGFIPESYFTDKIKFLIEIGYETSIPIMIFGPTALGKCVGDDTFVTLDNKLYLLGVFSKGLELKSGEFYNIGEFNIESLNNKFVRVGSFYYEKSKTRKTIFENGSFLVSTKNHPIYIYKKGRFYFTNNYEVGDYAAFKKININYELEFDIDKFFDGVNYISKSDRNFEFYLFLLNNIDFYNPSVFHKYAKEYQESSYKEVDIKSLLNGLDLNSVYSFSLGVLSYLVYSEKYYNEVEVDDLLFNLFSHLGLHIKIFGLSYNFEYLLSLFRGDLVEYNPINNSSYEKDGYYLFKVVYVLDNDDLDNTYDFYIPETHAFVSNGCISHNTTRLDDLSREKDCEFIKVELTGFTPGDIQGYPMISDSFLMGSDLDLGLYFRNDVELGSFIDVMRVHSNKVIQNLSQTEFSTKIGDKNIRLSFSFNDVSHFTKKYVLNSVYESIIKFLDKKKKNPNLKLVLFFDEVNRLPLGSESLISVVLEAISEAKILGYDLSLDKSDLFVVCAGNLPISENLVFDSYRKSFSKTDYKSFVEGLFKYIDRNKFGYQANPIDSALTNRGAVIVRHSYTPSDIVAFRNYVEKSGYYNKYVVDFVKNLTDKELFLILFNTEFTFLITSKYGFNLPNVRSLKDLSSYFNGFENELRSSLFISLNLDTKLRDLKYSPKFIEAFKISSSIPKLDFEYKESDFVKLFVSLLISEVGFPLYIYFKHKGSDYNFKYIFDDGLNERHSDLLSVYVGVNEVEPLFKAGSEFYSIMTKLDEYLNDSDYFKSFEDIDKILKVLVEIENPFKFWNDNCKKVYNVLLESGIIKDYSEFINVLLTLLRGIYIAENGYIYNKFNSIVKSVYSVPDNIKGFSEEVSVAIKSIGKKLMNSFESLVNESLDNAVSLSFSDLYNEILSMYRKSSDVESFAEGVISYIGIMLSKRDYESVSLAVGYSICVVINNTSSTLDCDTFLTILYNQNKDFFLLSDSLLSSFNDLVIEKMYEKVSGNKKSLLNKFII